MADLRQAAQQALEALRFYAEESHHLTLTGFKNGKRIDWDQERDRLEKAGYRFAHENHNSTEAYVEDGRRARDALNNLEEALSQQAEPVEPVAWISKEKSLLSWDKFYPDMTPLFTAPPQRKPLTDEEIDHITDQQWTANHDTPVYAAHRAYARAIERAHGITDPQVEDRLARHGIPMPGDPK